MGKYVRISRAAAPKVSPAPPRSAPSPFVAPPVAAGMDGWKRVEQADRFGHHLQDLEGGVLQPKWDPVENKDYEVWDELIEGRRWYRKQISGNYQYASEPEGQSYSIKIFLSPQSISGGVPQILLPPPPLRIDSGGFNIPSLPKPKGVSNINDNSGGFGGFKMPSLPKPKQVSSISRGAPPLSSGMAILGGKPNDIVTLARGCNSSEQFNSILSNKTAGGASPTSDPQAPTNEQAISGVAFEGAPWKVSEEKHKARRQVGYTEYSTDSSVTQSFGLRGGVVVIQVPRRLITQGSVTEGGWFINNDTPVKVIWSQEAKSETSEPSMIKKVKPNPISTTQKEAEEFRKNNSNDGDGDGDDGNGGNFV